MLVGATEGRLLAIPACERVPLLGPVLDRVRRLVAPRLPWRGKTFASGEHHRTTGRNRIFSFEAFPFDAHVEPSALDHAPTLKITYDRVENPRPLRPLVDELREVGRGLWLGPAWVRGNNGPIVLVWWGIVKA